MGGRCTAITRGGSRCKGVPIESSGYCHAHHPDRATARQRARRKDGKLAGRGRPLAEVHGLQGQLQDIADRVLSGDLERATGSAVGQILNVKRATIATGLAVRDATEVEARLAAIEEALGIEPGGERAR